LLKRREAMNLASIQSELRQAVVDLNARCLALSSRWAIEQLAGLDEELLNQHDTMRPPDQKETASPLTEDRQVMIGRSFFEAREYQRAAHALQSSQGSLALFLRLYSVFQA
jgi:anaphase-promoting complex subunit 8